MKAVVLVAFGCPDCLENIGPFMERIMGRTPPPALIAAVRSRYEKIGGKSPLTEITSQQARALKTLLGSEFLVDFAYQYWRPEIPEVVFNLVQKGAKTIYFLPMSAFNSQVSTGAYQKTIKNLEEKFPEIKFYFKGGLAEEPYFIEAHRQLLTTALQPFSPKNTGIIFTAHNLPKKAIEQGDPYFAEFLKTVEAIARTFPFPWRYAFQSKGKSGEEWLKPEVDDVIISWQNQGVENIIVNPIGFVADHIETLYDLDIELKEKFSTVNIVRLPALNDHPLLIKALHQLVQKMEG
ncbi:ferrochelatase [Carboxydothermus ferrireducens]|uniref:Coproporphyrin III ferrochelatase n=1 Tax=Carboxydothermus ferrireducens DSM 11255 TaxID=1119529 RepID=A0ABX2R5B7_9THEO|nr:ferrochelatase [Carboxydothermus ferrireducens]NYE56361.1 ferrochelatase [Carboxydothermus ferrireducens DSM 11255]